MNFNIIKKEKGFTIIELIISIFILSVAVVGIFGAFAITVILTSNAADRLTATYLAQEGMETIRNIRDTNWINMDYCNGNTTDSNCTVAPAWDDGLSLCEGSGCEVDHRTAHGITGVDMYPARPYESSDYLKTDANGFYYYDDTANGTPTKFQRKITITCMPDPTNCSGDYIMKVTTQVYWDQKASVINPAVSAQNNGCLSNGSNCITAEETLYDWWNYVQ